MKIEQLVEKYVKIRDKVAELDAEHKQRTAPYKEASEKIEQMLLAIFNETGQESAKTAFGTAYITKQTSATAADWEETLRFIQEKERWDMLERRVNKTMVGEYIEEHNEPPPGINWSVNLKVNIRRK